MTTFRQVVYGEAVPRDITGILTADIGGTNSNFGIFRHENGIMQLLFSLHVKSREITDFAQVVCDVLEYVKQKYNINIKRSVFAAAGVISEKQDYAKPTNLDFMVDSREIFKKSGLTCAFIVNDFEVIGYGIDVINPENLVLINKGKVRVRSNKAILGAGTGLGKCIMHWNKYAGRHIPVSSEGGHADFAAQSKLELELIKYIQHTEGFGCNISWEDVLSGNGIKRIYNFFKDRDIHARDISVSGVLPYNSPHPDEIFESRFQDEHSYNTFELYTKFYARCAKNFALDSLALGGIYIAGGIAAKNLQLFQLKAFMQEFVNCGKQGYLLKDIPIYVITDYNVSLYGAAQYMLLEGMCE